jgi:PhzF family phenazine biosynthesis protein
MKLPLYQIDAFTTRRFGGNPAAVCPLPAWLDDGLMLAIAAENNLSETAFFVPEGKDFRIRWFTPATEMDLCGHATLASAFVVFRYLDPDRRTVTFQSRSGLLSVTREGDELAMALPRRDPSPCAAPAELAAALGRAVDEVLAARDYLVVLAHEEEVRVLRPDLARVAALDRHAVIVTAPGSDCDFVSRFFAPQVGVPEDPVTGSAHCTLVPFWAGRLGKTHLRARQLSARGGELRCELRPTEVVIAGGAVPYLVGTIEI